MDVIWNEGGKLSDFKTRSGTDSWQLHNFCRNLTSNHLVAASALLKHHAKNIHQHAASNLLGRKRKQDYELLQLWEPRVWQRPLIGFLIIEEEVHCPTKDLRLLLWLRKSIYLLTLKTTNQKSGVLSAPHYLTTSFLDGNTVHLNLTCIRPEYRVFLIKPSPFPLIYSVPTSFEFIHSRKDVNSNIVPLSDALRSRPEDALHQSKNWGCASTSSHYRCCCCTKKL